MTAPVVLLNGWGMTSAVWKPLVSALPHWTLHPIDLTPLLAEGHHTLAGLAAAVTSRAPAHCSVVGWSLGAQVALQWARDCPAQVGRLALIAATPSFLARPGWEPGMPATVFEAFAAAAASEPSTVLLRFAALQARGERESGSVTRALRAAVARDSGVHASVLCAGLALLRAVDLRAAVTAIGQPVCLIHGAADALVPVAAARALEAMLPRSALDVLPGAGHAPHVSRPHAVAARLTDFLHGD